MKHSAVYNQSTVTYEIAMKIFVFTAVLGLSICAAQADVLRIDPDSPGPNAGLPERGMSMSEVRSVYGSAQTEHPPISTPGNAQHPPITRWDYPAFSVFFEHDTVVHALTPQRPPLVTGYR